MVFFSPKKRRRECRWGRQCWALSWCGRKLPFWSFWGSYSQNFPPSTGYSQDFWYLQKWRRAVYHIVYINYSDVVSFSEHVDGFANGSIRDVGKQDNISLIPLEWLGNAVDPISRILDNEHIFGRTVYLPSNICPHFVDEHLRFPSEPFLTIELSIFLHAATIINHTLWRITVTAVICIDVSRVYVKICESLLTEHSRILI
jgi:hypothetical protein